MGLIALYGAGDENRTRDIQLGRLTLYQLSYSRTASLRDLIRRSYMVVGEGFEPSKLSRQSYSLLGLTAPQPHRSVRPTILVNFTELSSLLALNVVLLIKWCRQPESNW
jgi:hypothetical protein